MNFLYKNLLSSSEYIKTIHKTHYNPSFDHLDYHPHYELYYCPAQIAQTARIFGTEYHITKPCLIISKPFTVHIMIPDDSSNPFERYVAYFSQNAINQFGDSILNKTIFNETAIYFPEENNRNLELLKCAFDESLSQSQRLMLLMAFISSKEIFNAEPLKTVFTENTAVKILEHISNNVDKRLDGASIANEFHISRATLDRIFKKYIGQSLHDTVTEQRLNTAATLLVQTKLSVAEIALKCGFDTEEYFFCFFKKHTGTTPLTFRKKHLQ
jgi:AraC-like DNA-binding protein